MSQPHILVIDEELPWPLNSGKRLRSYHLITNLVGRFRVTWLAHRNPIAAEIEPARQHFARLGIDAHSLNYAPPEKSGLGFYGNILRNLFFSRLPYSVASHSSTEMQRAIATICATDPPALIHCEWSAYAQNLRGVSVPFVVDAHNVELLIWQRLAAMERSRIKQKIFQLQAQRYATFERWAYRTAASTVAVSSADAQIIEQVLKCPLPVVIDNGVDTTSIPFQMPVDVKSPSLLFVGGLDWRPNQDAVVYFVVSVWPILRKLLPDITLRIVGRHPPDWLCRKIPPHVGIDLVGTVPDLNPYYRNATLMVVPLRIGGGSRLKILEAMAYGVPVVTSDIGAEGLQVSEHLCTQVPTLGGQLCPRAFAEAIVGAVNNPAKLQSQAIAGRQLVETRYDWRQLSAGLGDIWDDVIANGRKNFSKPLK
ncbi:MAG: glycosyltransferase family 4 protein [Zavarzinella sp.]